MRGDVFLSTISYCRTAEAAGVGDPGEATHVYRVDHVSGDPNTDSKVAHSMDQLGMGFGFGVDITLSQCMGIQAGTDGYLFCTAERYEPELMARNFGRYCVEISNPVRFYDLVSACIANARPEVASEIRTRR